MASARGDSSVGGQGDTRTGVDEPADVSPSILHNRDKVLRHLRIHPGIVIPHHTPWATIASTTSGLAAALPSLKNVQCSMPSTPAATAAAIPAVACACAVTGRPTCSAAATAASWPLPYCGCHGSDAVVTNPPVAITLIQSAPRAARSCTASTSSSTLSATPPRNQQCPPLRVNGGPETTSSGPTVVFCRYSSRSAKAA